MSSTGNDMTGLAGLEQAIADLGKHKEAMFALLRKSGWQEDASRATVPQRVASLLEPREWDTVVPERRALPPTCQVDYQRWYSTATAILVKNQPTRLAEFNSIYAEKARPRLQGLITARHMTKEEQHEIMDLMDRQYAIVLGVPDYLRAAMHDIELTVYSGVMGDELDAARHLLARGFHRAGGAVAGVVLERHLRNLARKHDPPIKVRETAGLSALNEACKDVVFDVPTWRKVQYLADLRNICDHDKSRDPTPEEAAELVSGVASVLSKS